MSDSQNPYQAPRSEVDRPATVAGGSIEATLAGRAHLPLGASMGEAWDRLKGAKRILLGGFLLFYVALGVIIALVIGFARGALGMGEGLVGVGSVVVAIRAAAL